MIADPPPLREDYHRSISSEGHEPLVVPFAPLLLVTAMPSPILLFVIQTHFLRFSAQRHASDGGTGIEDKPRNSEHMASD